MKSSFHYTKLKKSLTRNKEIPYLSSGKSFDTIQIFGAKLFYLAGSRLHRHLFFAWFTFGRTRYCRVLYGIARYSKVLQGRAKYCMALNDIVLHRMVLHLLHLWEGNCREFFLLFCSSVFPLHSLCLTSFKVRAAMLSWDNIFFLQRKREIVCKQRFFFKDTWCQASLISKFTIF